MGYCACLHGAHPFNADLHIHPIVLEMGLVKDFGKTFQPRPHVAISPLERGGLWRGWRRGRPSRGHEWTRGSYEGVPSTRIEIT